MRAETNNIDKLLKKFSGYNSTPKTGLTRVSYSEAYRNAVHELVEIMENLELKVCMDELGNIAGRREGRDPDLPAICVGSHLDSVRNGGIYDGPGGIVTGLELARILRDEDIENEHPFQVMSFVDEEGAALKSGLLGSRWFTEEISWKEVEPLGYVSSGDARKVIGEFRSYFSSLPYFAEAGYDPKNIGAFLEVHIEQGPVLESKGVHLGVVSSIAGTSKIEVTVNGRADHAGSTPMDFRADPFQVVARVADRMFSYARRFPQTVATVGQLEIPGGSFNRVPEKVWFTMDLRSADPHVMDSMIPEVEKILNEETGLNGTEAKMHTCHYVSPVALDPDLGNILRKHAADVTDTMDITSGAAHDTLVMARHYPSAMLFVPCEGGRSHCPEEKADPHDFALAAEVLYRSFFERKC